MVSSGTIDEDDIEEHDGDDDDNHFTIDDDKFNIPLMDPKLRGQ